MGLFHCTNTNQETLVCRLIEMLTQITGGDERGKVVLMLGFLESAG